MTGPTFFARPEAWRRWLAKNHGTEREILVGFHKVGSGRPSMTWPESVDEALCYGWIDGIRRRVDDESYTIRFTPRKPTSMWSLRNVERVAALEAEGRMRDAGRAAFAKRRADRTGTYSFERDEAAFADEELTLLRADAAAWADWQSRPSGYRRIATHWVTSAKRPATRAARLASLIESCRQGRKIKLLRRAGE